MDTVRILFMGASRLVGLLERFYAAANSEAVNLEILSLEDAQLWHAISVSGMAKVIPAPSFSSPEFEPFLSILIRERGIGIVIPNIDSATIAIAHLKNKFAAEGIKFVVSSSEICRAMYDKQLADKFFREHGLKVPDGRDYPLLAKPRFGASSRGHSVFFEAADYEFWLRKHKPSDYIIQPFIKGTEYSIDAYLSETGHMLGYVARVRVVVSDGEVSVARTEHNPRVEELVEKFLAIPGCCGPLTLQIMDTGEEAFFLECNPRFGSGVTCAIEAGLDIPRWIIREYLRRPLPKERLKWNSGLCMTRSRKDYFVWLSS